MVVRKRFGNMLTVTKLQMCVSKMCVSKIHMNDLCGSSILCVCALCVWVWLVPDGVCKRVLSAARINCVAPAACHQMPRLPRQAS